MLHLPNRGNGSTKRRNPNYIEPQISLFICEGIKVVIGEGRAMDFSTRVATIKITCSALYMM